MKLWLDDLRPAPEGWTLATTALEAIKLLSTNEVTACSLDHDLGPGKTGYDVLLWLEAYAQPITPLKISIHTGNPFAQVKMEQAVRAIYRIWFNDYTA